MARIQMWKTEAPGGKGSPAAQVCDLLVDNLPDASSFTFIDSCAGGGGPIPIMEATLNQKLRSQGGGPVRFILTDLFPAVSAWKALAKRSENISYIEEPVDATKAQRLAEPGKKECRIFNLCFHHFDDPAAATVLRSAVESADAFVYVPIQEDISNPPHHSRLTAIPGRQDLRDDPSYFTRFLEHDVHRFVAFAHHVPLVPLFSTTSFLHLPRPTRTPIFRRRRLCFLHSRPYARGTQRPPPPSVRS